MWLITTCNCQNISDHYKISIKICLSLHISSKLAKCPIIKCVLHITLKIFKTRLVNTYKSLALWWVMAGQLSDGPHGSHFACYLAFQCDLSHEYGGAANSQLTAQIFSCSLNYKGHNLLKYTIVKINQGIHPCNQPEKHEVIGTQTWVLLHSHKTHAPLDHHTTSG